MKTAQRHYLIGSTFLLMLIMAIVDSTKGILIPTFKSEFNLTDTSAGIFLTICTLTYMIATYFGGILCGRIGQKRIILCGLCIAIIGSISVAFSKTFSQVTITYIILTIGIASMVIGMNTMFPLLKVAYIGILMNCLHAFFGIGSTLTQQITGYLLYIGINWKNLFKAYAGLFFIVFIIYLFVKQPSKAPSSGENTHKKIKSKGLLLLFSLALGFYVASEMQTANWMLNYLKEVHHMNSNNGATYIALFFGLFSIGRLLGGFIAEKIGYMNTIIKSMTIAFILYSIGLVSGGLGLYLISLSGLFFAITFPTFLIVAQETFIGNPTHATGIITTSASAIAMIVGYVIGLLNDLVGPSWAIYIIPISMICCIILMIGINKLLNTMVAKNKLTIDVQH